MYCKIKINFEENALTQDASETLPPGLSSTVSSPDSEIRKEESAQYCDIEEQTYILPGSDAVGFQSHGYRHTILEDTTRLRIPIRESDRHHTKSSTQEQADQERCDTYVRRSLCVDEKMKLRAKTALSREDDRVMCSSPTRHAFLATSLTTTLSNSVVPTSICYCLLSTTAQGSSCLRRHSNFARFYASLQECSI